MPLSFIERLKSLEARWNRKVVRELLAGGVRSDVGLIRELESAGASRLDTILHLRRLLDLSFDKAVPTLIGILEKAEDRGARQMAAYWLSSGAPRELRDTARRALASAAADPAQAPDLRGEALEQLCYMASGQVRREERSLFLRALDDPEPAVRFWACFGISHLKIKAARGRLLRMAASDHADYPQMWRVSAEAKWALAVLDGFDPSPLQPHLPRLATPVPSHSAALRRAIDLAAENVRVQRGGPFGAVIVRDGRIIAEGTNRVTLFNDPTAHAEVVAIREACRQLGTFELTGCTLYASCEPCPMCLGAIYWSRLDRLYFAATRDDAANAGFDDSFIYDQVPLPASGRSLPTIPLLRAAGRKPFRLWARSNEKIRY